MANILLNCQSSNLRYAVEELSNHCLYSWRALSMEFAKTISPNIHLNIIENLDIYKSNRKEIIDEVFNYYQDIDLIFPLYNDMLFPYLYKHLGFTEQQGSILSNKQHYTALARQVGILVPNTYTDINQVTYPVIAKPVNGTGSIGVKVLQSYADYLNFISGNDIQYNNLGEYYIFQDFIQGTTVSCAGRIVDGNLLFDCSYTIKSSKLPYRAEIEFALVPGFYDDDVLKTQIVKLAQALKLDNCAWMADFIFVDGKFYLIDFSPRLSVSAQVLIKYSANIDYNRVIVDSLLYKDKSNIQLDKCVLYKYFDIAKGKYKIEFNGDANLADELVLPAHETYMSRMDILMPFKGYAVTSGATIDQAAKKFNDIAINIAVREL
jgi:predicted ATP-grasp superfamily ATP-dependent carboligase